MSRPNTPFYILTMLQFRFQIVWLCNTSIIHTFPFSETRQCPSSKTRHCTVLEKMHCLWVSTKQRYIVLVPPESIHFVYQDVAMPKKQTATIHCKCSNSIHCYLNLKRSKIKPLPLSKTRHCPFSKTCSQGPGEWLAGYWGMSWHEACILTFKSLSKNPFRQA